MRIAVKALPYQKEEWLLQPLAAGIELIWADNEVPAADAYFDLAFEEMGAAFVDVTDQPVFVNAIMATTQELPPHTSRINAWKGFLNRPRAEVVLNHAGAAAVLDALGWKYHAVPDVPGMIAPRVISMIINEAYFALGDGVSTPQEIDTAMKLGTNYPYGPFEWSEQIGLHRVYRLLHLLAATDARYQPAEALIAALKSIA